jgi:hypothetical protein
MGWATAGLASKANDNPTANSKEIAEEKDPFLTSHSQISQISQISGPHDARARPRLLSVMSCDQFAMQV